MTESALISGLMMINADREKILWFHGRMTGLQGSLNPYIGEDPMMPMGFELKARPDRMEVERLLQMFMKSKIDVVRATVVLIEQMPVSVVTKTRVLLARSLEDFDEQKAWYAWTAYIGKDFEAMSPDEQIIARDAMEKWWKFMEVVYDRIVQLVLDSTNGMEITRDVETGLGEWRNISKLVAGASDYEEVFVREKLIFLNCLETLVGWEKRRDHINEILRFPALGLQNLIDYRVVQLKKATNYEEWYTCAGEIFELASAKGIAVEGAKVKEQDRPRGPCFKCHKLGHIAANCPMFNALVNPASVPGGVKGGGKKVFPR